MKGFARILAVGALLCASGNAFGVMFSSSSGNLAASADFQLSGSTLTVTLTNTSGYDVLVPADVLTALFFSSNGTLTEVSAVLNAGSSVYYDPDGQPAGGVVGGEWAYGSGLSGAPMDATQGISSAGFGLFGGSTFPGADLAPPAALDGLNYGILSAGDNTGTGNAGVTGSGGQIKNSVVFTFTASNGFTLDSITDVSFQYGTALDEPNIHNGEVPAPGAILLGVMGLGLVGAIRRRFA